MGSLKCVSVARTQRANPDEGYAGEAYMPIDDDLFNISAEVFGAAGGGTAGGMGGAATGTATGFLILGPVGAAFGFVAGLTIGGLSGAAGGRKFARRMRNWAK
jgi:hypothetical protein